MAKKQKNKLPEWDLSDLYPAMDSKEFASDLRKLEKASAEFENKYKGRIAILSGNEFAAAITEYEKIEELEGKLASFAFLVYAGDISDENHSRFFQDTNEKLTVISTKTLFFSLEINRIDEKEFAAKLNSSQELRKYQPWLRDLRVFREHQLSDEVEKILHEKDITGRQAFVRLFDETFADLRFPFEIKQLTSTEILDLLSHKNEKKRKKAAKIFGEVLSKNKKIFAFITNTLAKEKAIEDEWRKYKRPISARNLSNYIEDEVVDALISAVKKGYPQLSHRYYKIKAGWLGKKRLDYWDRNAPLPEVKEKKIPWDEAVSITLDAYNSFSPELYKLGCRFFDNQWIDAPPREGKESGAFAHPTIPSVHPYLLLNYQGKVRDVMTLAHELGHGIHQLLSAEQGALMADTPLTLAETASVFGEQLVFRELLKREKNEKRRRHIIAGKVEDMLNTVVRQAAFCEFERMVHDERRKGELPVKRIEEIWIQVQKESFGDSIKLGKEYRSYWSYIPHFIHSPFYVYAYAFGDCLVNALYSCYLDGMKGFKQQYFAMLRAGGTLRHKELLAPFGLDASDPKFWRKGLDIISGFIDELE